MSKNSRIYPDWNPNALRSNSFPDCHWKLCLQFMDRHKNLLPPDQLYALAHIFANTQLLLRGDADQTMQLVLDLVKEQLPAEGVDLVENSCWEKVAEPEFLESSPVVEMEALDISASDDEVAVKEEPEEMVEALEEVLVTLDCPKTEAMTSLDCKNESSSNVEMEEVKDTVPESAQVASVSEAPTKFIRVVPAVEPISMESFYNNLILMDENFEKTQTHFNRLKCGRLEMILKQHADLSHSATVKIDGRVLAQSCGKKRPQAQAKAIQLFFANMRDHCYRIETLLPANLFQSTSPDVVPRQTVQQLQQANCPERINESNLGFRMLQKIGWTGGALGANAQGRLDPVECSTLRKGRAGIGAVQEETIDPAHYRQVMKDFGARNGGAPLVFSAEFTNRECQELQRIASQLRLDGRIVSQPKGVKRFAVLPRELPPQEIVRRIVIEQDVGLSAQYRVVPPKRSASFSKADPTPEVVPDCPKAPESTGVCTDKSASEGSENDSQSSSEEESDEEDHPASATTLNVLSQKPQKKSTLDAEFCNEILESLTRFKPIRPLRSIEDVFHNIVLIGRHTIARTAKEFEKLGSGKLRWINRQRAEGGFCARIVVGEFVLTEVCNLNQKMARKGVMKAFFEKAAMFCYRLSQKNYKKDKSNAVSRNENPNTNIEFYRNIIEHFAKDGAEQDLMFDTKFTKNERNMLKRIAHEFHLRTVNCGRKGKRRLCVHGKKLPALATVERIVVHKDPWLMARYEVTPPRIGARLVDGDSL
uniref:G-patch domain-containing protein n=1 Tax=Culex tarsalis TaxID=7177 RepID=A0A1Q3FWC2_CULTA